MKIRTDFVTNSSSSSFIVQIEFELNDGSKICFEGEGATDESGPTEYFDGEVLVTVSPKELATAVTVDEMIKRLTDGVLSREEEWDENDECTEYRTKIFEAQPDFINILRSKIKSMDDINSVTITGDEENYFSYLRTYTYERKSKKYYGRESQEPYEREGQAGGDLKFDVRNCNIEHIES